MERSKVGTERSEAGTEDTKGGTEDTKVGTKKRSPNGLSLPNQNTIKL